MRKYLGILLALSFSSSLWAGATFSRAHNWVDQEVLTAADLNAEFNNILNNLDPAGIDDYSLTLTQMQTVVDPYPATVESLATDLKGEIERLRYQILQLKKSIQSDNNTYWYQDAPDPGTFTIKTSSVGINNTSPSYSLDVNGTQRVTGNAVFSSSASIANTLSVSTITSVNPYLYITTNTSVLGGLSVTGNLSIGSNLSIADLVVSNSITLTPYSLVIGAKNSIQDIPYNTSYTNISYTTSVDRNSEVSGGVFTAKKAGVYLVKVQYSMSNSAGIGSCDGSIALFKNSTALRPTAFSVDGTNTYDYAETFYISLAINDTLIVKISRSANGYAGAAIRVAVTSSDTDNADFIYRLP